MGKKYKLSIYEIIFLSIVVLDITAYFYYIYGLINNQAIDAALRSYYLNNGIIIIATITFVFEFANDCDIRNNEFYLCGV